jgi:hypothetical protein
MGNVAIVISLFSLLLSVLTFYLLYLRKGKIQLTQPTIVRFQNYKDDEYGRKIALRAHVFNSAARGGIVENMWLTIQNKNMTQVFQLWGFSNERDGIERATGFYVSQEGNIFSCYFCPRFQNRSFKFVSGDYKIEVYASAFNQQSTKKISEINLLLTSENCEQLEAHQAEISFELDCESKQYFSTAVATKTRPTKLPHGFKS